MTPRVMVIATIPETIAGFFVPQLRIMAEAGFDVHVVSSPGPVLEGLAVGSRVSVHGVPMERRPHPLRDCISLWRLVSLMRCVRPHIVHAHTPKAGLLGMAAARLAGVPARLYTVHGLPLLTRSGAWRRVLEAAERASVSLSTQTYAVSNSVRTLLVEMNLCPVSKARVLGDGSCGGVDVERFRPQPELRSRTRDKMGIPAHALVVTFVGRLARDKGIAVLADAWSEVARVETGIHLVLAGEPDVSDPPPESALQSLRRAPRVHFAGSVPREDVPAVYAATDIAVLPTFREGLSQVSLEAGAAGVALVSTRVSGMDAVEDGVTGLLVPPGQAAPLSEAILRLASKSALRQRLGAAARARIESCYSDQRVNRLWMMEYLRLADMSPRPWVEVRAAR